MGKIFYILGKSASGKDTIYKKLCNDKELNLKSVVLYTTRPIREGEIDKVTYNFVTEKEYEAIKKSGSIIEERSYDTIHGVWRYFTAIDNDFSLNSNYIMIGVLSSYVSIKNYFGDDNVVPLYIEVDDGTRLERALKRERKPENGKYAEMCRRFLADSEDFSEEKIKEANITKKFENIDFDECIKEIKGYIKQEIK